MAITVMKIDATMKKVNRLMVACIVAKKAIMDSEDFEQHPKETGAVRRASMDLTRSLADLRRS